MSIPSRVVSTAGCVRRPPPEHQSRVPLRARCARARIAVTTRRDIADCGIATTPRPWQREQRDSPARPSHDGQTRMGRGASSDIAEDFVCRRQRLSSPNGGGQYRPSVKNIASLPSIRAGGARRSISTTALGRSPTQRCQPRTAGPGWRALDRDGHGVRAHSGQHVVAGGAEHRLDDEVGGESAELVVMAQHCVLAAIDDHVPDPGRVT